MPEEEATRQEREQTAPDPPAESGEVVAVDADSPAAPSALSGEQLARLRATLVAANPEAVPELIAGADFDALLASVEPARAAYARIREEAARQVAAGVPRGGGVREIDPAAYADLSPEAKIATAFERRA